MDLRLRGAVAVVTGGGTGIGRAIAAALGREGAHLVLVGRRPEPLAGAAAAIGAETGVRVLTVAGDVRDEATLDAAMDATRDLGRLDVLVNNAGGQFVAPAELISRRGWAAVIDVDLTATFLWSQRAARRWIEENRTGAVVNIVGPFRDRATPGMAHSGAARAAVVHLARTLAVEWAPFGIRVNNVGPAVLTQGLRDEFAAAEGSVVDDLTRRLPMGRWGSEEEVGELVAFLASPAAGYVTGETVVMDGGAWSAEGFGMRPLSDRRWVLEPGADARRDWARALAQPDVNP